MPIADPKTLHVAITGAGGILGTALQEVLPDGLDPMKATALTRADLDVTRPDDVRRRLEEIRPDAVIHAGAYTGVDGCEEEPGRAREVNVDGTAHVARTCRALNCRLLYLSTDYVFDGKSDRPYREDDPVSPLGVYGNTKWEGEEAVRREGPEDSLIVRTSWVYGRAGRNFVDAILEKGALAEPLRVVTDQRGSPTYARDLAEALQALLLAEAQGTVHVTGGGDCSWYDFAREILMAAGQDPILVEPTTSRALGRRAPRPAYSVMDGTAYRRWTGRTMRPWGEALRDYLKLRGSLLES
jgi:dTDP-4-dehydrorhamnose reductase